MRRSVGMGLVTYLSQSTILGRSRALCWMRCASLYAPAEPLIQLLTNSIGSPGKQVRVITINRLTVTGSLHLECHPEAHRIHNYADRCGVRPCRAAEQQDNGAFEPRSGPLSATRFGRLPSTAMLPWFLPH